MNNKLFIPADVPTQAQQEFTKNYEAITHKTGNLMLFAGDQKIEHLNKDFYGANIHPDANWPKHLFAVASKGRIGVFASHLGLIARYGKQFPHINYLIKLNGKTNLIKTEQRDPMSKLLWHAHDAITLKKDTDLPICAIGLTIYLGSTYESQMLSQATQEIYRAHQHGLVTVVWMYPRGKSVTNEKDADLIAGAAGVANALGADFVKVNVPEAENSKKRAELLQQAVAAAGNTKLICSGGTTKNPELFLQELYDQLHIAGAAGNATGRNIYQQSEQQAIAMTEAISAIVLDGKNVQEALHILNA